MHGVSTGVNADADADANVDVDRPKSKLGTVALRRTVRHPDEDEEDEGAFTRDVSYPA